MGFDFGIGEAALTAADVASASAIAAGAGDVAALTAPAVTAIAAPAASTLSSLATAGSILGGVTSAFGAIQGASAQRATAQYQAQVAANNQQIATQNAQQAAAAGAATEERQSLKTRATVGAIKAAQAASNIDVNTGSAVDVRSSAAELGELDALTIRSNAARQAYGYETQATSFGGQSQLASNEAAQAPIAGAFGATGSLLSGASGVASQYANWQLAAGNGNAPVRAIF